MDLLELVSGLREVLNGGVVVGGDLLEVLQGGDDLVEILAREQKLNEVAAAGLHLVRNPQGLGGGVLLCREFLLNLGEARLVGVDLLLELIRMRDSGVVGTVALVDAGLELTERGGPCNAGHRKGKGEGGGQAGADGKALLCM